MQSDILSPGPAPTRPQRADPRHLAKMDAQGHIRGVAATSGGLVRATLGSALAAGAILVFAWLPAEYGIDPTGVGTVLGLTEMGEIKQQLYAEAAADDAAAAAPLAAPVAATAPVDPAFTERLDAIEAQLTAIAAIIGAPPAPSAEVEVPDAPEVAAAPEPTDLAARTPPSAAETTAATATAAAPVWRDEVSYTLAPTEGIEVKLVMEEGAVATFEWTANGSVLNYDTHGDGSGQKISYEQGRGVPGQDGELVAAFTGNHGWFWRNRTDAPVTVTLRTLGDYAEMKAP